MLPRFSQKIINPMHYTGIILSMVATIKIHTTLTGLQEFWEKCDFYSCKKYIFTDKLYSVSFRTLGRHPKVSRGRKSWNEVPYRNTEYVCSVYLFVYFLVRQKDRVLVEYHSQEENYTRWISFLHKNLPINYRNYFTLLK